MQQLKKELVDRFTRYVRIDTQSDPASTSHPSTKKQFDLAKVLVEELKAVGVQNIELTEQCYVYGTYPSNLPKEKKAPAIGLIAHLDTAPDVSGANVKPVFHENYDGKDLTLPGDSSVVIRVSESPELKKFKGDTIITSDGTTLLGADDKAGIAVIVSLIGYLRRHPEIPHGTVRIAFTPDEEIGQGADHFDVKRFGAEYAYTVDGSNLGEIEDETFCADSADVVVTGVNIHPGYAKNKMINSMKAAAEILARLPQNESPETTEKRQGYLHPNTMEGNVEKTVIHFIVRDFEEKGLKEKEEKFRKIVEDVGSRHKGVKFDVVVKEQYRNMRYKLDEKPEAVEMAKEGIRRAGLEPRMEAIRGGTDGARLCYMGLPTPNLFSGAQNFHSRKEWIPVSAMVKSVEALSHILTAWTERK